MQSELDKCAVTLDIMYPGNK